MPFYFSLNPYVFNDSVTRETSNLITATTKDFIIECYFSTWGELKQMVYPRLKYWLLTIIGVVC